MTTDQWRKLSIGLAVVLFFMLGVSIAVLLNPGAGPGATAAPSQATTSSRPTARPTVVSSTEPSTGPSTQPSLEPTEVPSAEPTEEPTATAAPVGGIPVTRIRFESVGLDQTGTSGALARRLVFKSDGKVQVTARLLASAGGKTRMCLQEGTRTATCISNTTGIIRGTPRATSTTWTMTLIGVKGGTPVAQVQVDYPSRSPRLTLSGFVLKGTEAAPYNGFAVDASTTKKGPLRLTATFTSGGAASSQAWRWSLVDLEPGTASEFARSGTGASTFLSRNVAGPARYRVSIGSTAATVSGTVKVSATLTWP